MRSFLTAAAALVTVHADCESTLTDWFTANLWIAGPPSGQLSGVETLCCADGVAIDSCAPTDAMLLSLEAIATECGAGAGDETIVSLTGLIRDLMCSNHDGVYCLTNVLSFIDFAYLAQLQDPAASLEPNLDAVLAAPSRREAMCSSKTCRYEVFSKVEAALGAPSAKVVVKDISQKIFCGCEDDPDTEAPCHDQDLFLVTGGLDTDKACTDDGEISRCARVNAVCKKTEAYATTMDPTVCGQPVEMEQVASFVINFGNIKFAWYESNQDTVKLALASDFMVNFRGLLPQDCTFEFTAAADGSLSVSVVIKGEDLNVLLKLREMIDNAEERAVLKLFVLAALETVVPNTVEARTVIEFLSEDITISAVEVTEVEKADDGSSAPAVAVGAAAVLACAL